MYFTGKSLLFTKKKLFFKYNHDKIGQLLSKDIKILLIS